jgi:two-component system LytT family sensor kinase
MQYGKKPRLVGLSFAKVNLLAWVLFGAVAIYVRWLLQDDLVRAVGFTLVVESAAFLLSLVLLVIYERCGVSFQLRTAILVAGLSLLASLILASLAHLFADLADWHNPLFTQMENAMLRAILMWIVFLCWSFAYFWLRTEAALKTETRIAEEAVQDSHRIELQMLRAQLDPHFLFNSLNGIAAEISPHPEIAREMVRKLSLYLRYSLDHRKRSISPLSDELHAMECYLDIEQARFGDRLSVTIHASEEARWWNVPSFLLQPLVENAIKHGLHESRRRLDLGIQADVIAGALELVVTNSGQLRRPGNGGISLGLDTLSRRLDLHYPGRHRFELTGDGDRVRAFLQLQGEPCSA